MCSGLGLGMHDGGLAYCIALSVLGSFSYVCGIMSLAYPAFLVEHHRGGEPFSRCSQAGFLGLYFLGQSGALAFPLVGSWYGPVSIALPVYQATMLLWNMAIMQALGMEKFRKHQAVGTEVIVVATAMLIDAGPSADGIGADDSFGSSPLDASWLFFLGLLWLGSLVGMVQDALGAERSQEWVMAVYVVAQGIGTSSTTTLGKLLSMQQGVGLVAVMTLYISAGLTNTYSSVVAAKYLDQGVFIPYASVCSLLLNQTSGLILWQDWRSIHLWVTYIGIHILILLGMCAWMHSSCQRASSAPHRRQRPDLAFSLLRVLTPSQTRRRSFERQFRPLRVCPARSRQLLGECLSAPQRDAAGRQSVAGWRCAGYRADRSKANGPHVIPKSECFAPG